jgi:hypothetical protein
MLKNPFHKKKSVSEKISETLHIPTKHGNSREEFFKRLQNTFLYVSLFLAGYIIAKLEVLMK